MITIKEVKTLDGETTTLNLSSRHDHVIDAEGLFLLPGLIDPHLSCGSPERDQWRFTIESAIKGGVTSLIDIPSHDFHSETMKELQLRKRIVEKRLAELKIPLRYFLYGIGNSKLFEEIALEKKLILGSILILKPEDVSLADQTWDRIFQLAAWEDFPIVINSRNENAQNHAAGKAPEETILGKALYFAEKQNTRLYVLNVATQQVIDQIEDARKRSLLVYAETTLQHLFPRDGSQANFLWDALNKGIIETIGSGYCADAESGEKVQVLGEDFDFLNPRFLLPMLLSAHLEGKITLENIVRATRVNLYDVFKIERKDQDVVLVDLEKERIVARDYQGKKSEMRVKGWPVYTVIQGQIFSSAEDSDHLDRMG